MKTLTLTFCILMSTIVFGRTMETSVSVCNCANQIGLKTYAKNEIKSRLKYRCKRYYGGHITEMDYLVRYEYTAYQERCGDTLATCMDVEGYAICER